MISDIFEKTFCINCGSKVREDYDAKLEIVRFADGVIQELETWNICPVCDVPEGPQKNLVDYVKDALRW
jgi:hypothetical protein